MPVLQNVPSDTRTSVETLLHRDRWIVGVALATAVALCWAWLVPMALRMQREGMMCGVTSWATCGTGDLAMLFAMWAVMMAGMMLPSAAPALLLYARVIRHSPGVERGQVQAQVYAFAGAYLLVWTAFSLVATLLQRLLAQSLLLNPMMETSSAIFGGVLLMVAGIYQLTPWKRSCLDACRSPIEFMTRHWKPGVRGGFYLGLANGLFCLGCCWALMLLLFVGGVMNLWCILALTVFVLLEKVAPRGAQGGRLSGVLLFATGIWIMLR
jgi:predicted metal-binding membrane protein